MTRVCHIVCGVHPATPSLTLGVTTFLLLTEKILCQPDAGLFHQINQGVLTADGIDDPMEMRIADVRKSLSQHFPSIDIKASLASLCHYHHYVINIIVSLTSLCHWHYCVITIIVSLTSLCHDHHYVINIIVIIVSLTSLCHYHHYVITIIVSSPSLCHWHHCL